jgi:protein O-mannosyl-transferase
LMGDRELALKMIERAVTLEPVEPAYRITLARMALACGKPELAQQQIASLRQLNIGGRLNDSIRGLEASTPESLQ